MSLKSLTKRTKKIEKVFIEELNLTFVMEELSYAQMKLVQTEEDANLSDLLMMSLSLKSVVLEDGTSEEGPFEVEDIQGLYENISLTMYSKLQDTLINMMGVPKELGKT